MWCNRSLVSQCLNICRQRKFSAMNISTTAAAIFNIEIHQNVSSRLAIINSTTGTTGTTSTLTTPPVSAAPANATSSAALHSTASATSGTTENGEAGVRQTVLISTRSGTFDPYCSVGFWIAELRSAIPGITNVIN